jgi:hypothetical protein
VTAYLYQILPGPPQIPLVDGDEPGTRTCMRLTIHPPHPAKGRFQRPDVRPQAPDQGCRSRTRYEIGRTLGRRLL